MKRRDVGKDAGAGLTLGLVSVPDGLAMGLLAGVNPVAGLYGYLVGTMAGALATSSVFMSVQATGAMAVLISDVPGLSGTSDSAAVGLATLGVLTGLVMLTFGLLKLGTLVRFVPNAVLTGFLNAVALNIILGQLSGFTGYVSDAGNRLTRAIDTLLHPLLFDVPTLAIGVCTLLLILLLERTPLGPLGLVVAVVVTSAVAAALGLATVPTLSDVAPLPESLPTPILPSLSLVPGLLIPALSLALVGLVQGAGISQSIPNPDGSYPDVSGDFRGQGVANIASGLLRGMPVGGSLSATSLVTVAGARSRLANLFAGIVMIAVILVLGGIAGYIAMPALAALLILIGFRTFKIDAMVMVWRTGRTQAAVLVATFVLTVVIPLQYAVLIGVGASLLLFVIRQSNKIQVVSWTIDETSRFPVEGEPPRTLPPREVVILTVYGSVFFASAPVLEAQLPAVSPESTGSVVILRLRGKEDIGSTFIRVLGRYQDALEAVGGHLLLCGVGDRVLGQLSKTGMVEQLGPDNVFAATPVVMRSLEQALDRAHAILGEPTP
jgi:SulP family sulfate permease